MVAPVSTETLRSAARRNWRYFLPVWILPVALFSLIFVPAWSSHTDLVFWLLMCPALIVSMYVAGIPIRKGLATVSHTAVWAIVFPLLIWVLVIVVFFGLYFALRATNAA